VNRNHKPVRWLQATVGLASFGACLLTTGQATAEVTVAKGETWDAYVSGRVGAFASYAFGEGRPVPAIAGSKIEPGGGVDNDDPTLDTIYEYDAMGMPLPKQGKLDKLRVRSGYYPNILAIGAHKTFGPQLKLTSQVSIWGTIEPVFAKGSLPPNRNRANGGRENGVEADFREGFLRLEGGWGELNGGRFMSVFGRGLTEIDALYGHGYGVGFPMVSRSYIAPVTGDLKYQGPTGGMTGFGVLSATYAAGVTYTTPSMAGLKMTLGVFDPATYNSAGWTRTSVPRPEAEIAYDLRSNGLVVHVFGSGGFQPLLTPRDSTSIWGASGGARLELGPVRVGFGGFLGRAPGINYAFDDNPALSSSTAQKSVTTTTPDGTVTTSMVKSYDLRNTRGFVGMLQVALGPVDVSAGAGQTVVLQVDADKANAALVSTLKSQTAITAAVVYHLNESFHLDLDFINGGYKWYNGESEKLNLLNAGATVTF
jgi:hypothetical protein